MGLISEKAYVLGTSGTLNDAMMKKMRLRMTIAIDFLVRNYTLGIFLRLR